MVGVGGLCVRMCVCVICVCFFFLGVCAACVCVCGCVGARVFFVHVCVVL